MHLAKLEYSQDDASTVTGILMLFYKDRKGSLPAFYAFSKVILISKGRYQIKCKLQLKCNLLQNSCLGTFFISGKNTAFWT